MCFDKKNNELMVTNDSYQYSYVYSFESGYWHKTDKSYKLLINSYPEVLALHANGSNDGIFNLSAEDLSNSVPTMLTTRPCKLDGEANFTLLHRAIQRCKIETKDNVYAGFYIFGSNDLKTWQLLAGNDRKTGKITDIFATRTHLKVKYYIFVFAAELKLYDSLNSRKMINTINTLEVQYYPKIINKLR
jgi:hypothetical protein